MKAGLSPESLPSIRELRTDDPDICVPLAELE
jgi:hypothetical protein